MNNKRWLLKIVVAAGLLLSAGQKASAQNQGNNEPPRLIVIVSVDQLCQEYLQRFRNYLLGDKKFFALVEEQGIAYRNCHHQHAFTLTAPGHSTIGTGAYPAVHGIVANEWFDRYSGKQVYCCSDSAVENLGTVDPDDAATQIGMSPRNLQVDTIGDVLKLASGGKSKVYGISWKDRAGILMAGHAADAAFWMQKGEWITSTYYRDSVPGYLRNINQAMLKPLSKKEWKLSFPVNRYSSWLADDNPTEQGPAGFSKAFPHVLPDFTDDTFLSHLPFTPFANELTLQVAMETIKVEQLGGDPWPDLLCVGLSANDFVGHAFGPQSFEVEDMLYRTDAALLEFVNYLNKNVGQNNWTLILSSDHAVAPIPRVAAELKLPAQRSPLGDVKNVKAQLEAHLRDHLDVKESANPLVLHVDAGNVYLQHGHRELLGERFYLAQKIVRDFLLENSAVSAAYTRDDMLQGSDTKLKSMLQKAWHPRRSGDVVFVMAPYAVAVIKAYGTTHGSPWQYDTHVPLILLGHGIRSGGRPDRQVSPAAIAPTIARMLGIDPPAASVEGPLNEALGR